MKAMTNHAPFLVWGICFAILHIKMIASSFVQAYFRKKRQMYARPEDAEFFSDEGKATQRDAPESELAQKLWQNDLENIPMFTIAGLFFVLAGGSLLWSIIYFVGYTLFRLAHTFFFFKVLQPYRLFSYFIGLLLSIIIPIHAVILLLM